MHSQQFSVDFSVFSRGVCRQCVKPPAGTSQNMQGTDNSLMPSSSVFFFLTQATGYSFRGNCSQILNVAVFINKEFSFHLFQFWTLSLTSSRCALSFGLFMFFIISNFHFVSEIHYLGSVPDIFFICFSCHIKSSLILFP